MAPKIPITRWCFAHSGLDISRLAVTWGSALLRPRLSHGGLSALEPKLVLAEVGAVPPTAAEGLEEGRGIRVAVGFRLNEVHQGLLVGLLGG